jgi:hypothetical protein
MKIEDISQLMKNAILRGVAKAVPDHGVISPAISKADAYRLYGRSNVDRWLAEGLIKLSFTPGNTSKRFMDRNKLDSVAAASNRHTYLQVADRKL